MHRRATRRRTRYQRTLLLGLQSDYELEEAHRDLAKKLARIERIAA